MYNSHWHFENRPNPMAMDRKNIKLDAGQEKLINDKNITEQTRLHGGQNHLC